jgi:hypothetical protein
VPRARGRLADLQGKVSIGFQNQDAPARGITIWTQNEILQMLRDLGLPQDSPLSVLCVEMMPTLATLRTQTVGAAYAAGADLATGVRLERSGISSTSVSTVSGYARSPTRWGTSGSCARHRSLRFPRYAARRASEVVRQIPKLLIKSGIDAALAAWNAQAKPAAARIAQDASKASASNLFRVASEGFSYGRGAHSH